MMNGISPQDSPQSDAPPSAFPQLPDSVDELPSIPGGWKSCEVEFAEQTLHLMRPADPDLFLDDAEVHRKNEKNDYMPYWAFLWPSAVKMAAAVQRRADWPAGSSVLELGAGIGLVGLSCLLRGDHVTFSDYDATALHLCRLNAHRNGLSTPELLELDWREIPERKFPVIVGCEVTYDAALHEPLLDLIHAMLEKGGVCWLADPGRFQAPFFFERAVRKGFRVSVQNELGETFDHSLSNEFQIFRLDCI